MSESADNPGQVVNLWAPWRMEYIHSLSGPEGECFLCRDRDNQADDDKNLVLWRGPRCLAVLNRFPYTGGHALVAPNAHVADLGDLDTATMTEIMEMVRDVQKALQEVVHAHGFNIGINLGRCAGAGLPGHLHVHVVPRWNGDTNFVSVFSGARVISSALDEVLMALRAAGTRLNLPRLTP